MKAADGTFFAAVEPQSGRPPLAVEHFKDRFADQPWLIYDVKRQYGYYYDLKEMKGKLLSRILNKPICHRYVERKPDEGWQRRETVPAIMENLFLKAICIKERWNPRKHRQDAPVRYWKYLTEKHNLFLTRQTILQDIPH